jgi:hypothetical protein
MLPPTTHAFEGMRTALANGLLAPLHIMIALGLDVLYLVGAALAFAALFRGALTRGLFVKTG